MSISFGRFTRNLYFYATIVFAVYVFVLDYYLHMKLALGLSYSLILIFSLFQQGRRPVINSASAFTVLIIIGAFFSTSFQDIIALLVNRFIDILLVWFAAFLIMKFKKMESDRLETQLMFEKTLDTAPTAIIISRKDDNSILYVNDAGSKMIGLSKEKLTGTKSNTYYVHPEKRNAVIEKLNGKEKIENFELEITTADGKIIPVLTSVQAIKFREIDSIITVNVDISFQKKVEKKFRDLLESAPDSMVIVDKKGEIVLSNARTEELFGYQNAELIGNKIEILIPDNMKMLHEKHRDQYSKNPVARNMGAGLELFGKRKNGESFPVEVSLSPIETEDETLISAAIRDIAIRKEREKEIVRSRNYYLTLLEEFPTMIWRAGTDGQRDYFNQTWLTFTGRSFEEEKGEGWTENIHPDDLAQYMEIYEDAIKERKSFNFDYRLKRHDGIYRWVNVNGRPMYDFNGKFTGFIGTSLDVTEKRESEIAIRESEQKFHAIFNQTFQFIGLFTPEGYVVEINDTALEFANIALEDVVGKAVWETPWWQIPDEQTKLKDAVSEASKGKFIRYESKVIGNNDEALTIDFSLKPVYDDEGKQKWLIAEGRDISEIKEAQHALIESEEKYRTLNDSAQDAIIVADESGKIISWNNGARNIFGYPENEILEKPIQDLIPEKYIDDHNKGMLKFTSINHLNGKGKVLELEGKKKSGDIFPIELSLSSWKSNGSIYFSAIIRDISERKKDEQQIQLYNSISKIIGEAKTFNEAIESTLEEICNTFHLSYGEIWLPDPNIDSLSLQLIYFNSDKDFSHFIEESRKIKFAVDEGLPGKVFAQEKPLFYDDLAATDEHKFYRKDLAAELEIKNAFGVPIFDKGEAIGVMTFLSENRTEKIRNNYIDIISSVSSQIGTLFIKKQAEEALKESEENLEKALINTPVPIVFISLSKENIIFANKSAKNILALSDQDLNELPFDFYAAPEDRPILQAEFHKKGVIENYESTFIRNDGNTVNLMISVREIKLKNDSIAVVTMADITYQKKTEKKFRDLLESAPDAMIIFDKDGKVLIVNAQTEKFFGYNKNELLYQQAEMLMPKQLRARAREYINRHFNNSDNILSETLESKGLRKNGSLFPVEISFGTIETEEGTLFSAAIRDISDRKQAQLDLIAKHRQLMEAQEVAHIGSWEWDIEKNDLSWSDEMYNIYGLDPDKENIDFDTFLQHVHPDDVEYIQSIINKALEDQKPFNMYHRIITVNGDLKVLNGRGKVEVKGGKVVKMIGTGMDVTELKMAEEKIRESEEKFRYFVETSNDLIWSIDEKNRWNYVNPEACRQIYEYDPQELIGTKFIDIALRENNNTEHFLKQLNQEGYAFHHELIHQTKSGNIVYLKFNGVLLRDKNGKVIGATGTATDISELKSAEESLREIESTLRSLYDITTGPETLEAEQKIDALLRLGCEKFKMDVAYILQIKDNEDSNLIQSYSCNSDLPIDNIEPILEKSFVPGTLKMDDPFFLVSTKKSPYNDLELFSKLKMKSFIGEKIIINGVPFGTLNLVSKKKKKSDFKQTDLEIIKLMAQWVAGVLQREQIKQNLMNAIVDTEEQERKRFAEDLHDGLGQILSAVKLNLSAMDQSVKNIDDGSVQDFFENSKSLIDYAMQEAKAISQNLMPAALDNYGIQKTMETLCERISHSAGITVNFHSFNLEERYPRNVEIGLYRIGQELINNVIKHAEAEEVNIQIIQHKNSIMLMAEDDGKGFDISKNGHQGLGLNNMMTRVKSLHGTISIDSSPGYGTVITIEIPLNR